MKQFFKFTLASMLGFFLTSIVVGFISMLIFFAAISSLSKMSKDEDVDVKENTVLHINFSQPIPDRGSKNPMDNFDFTTFKSIDAPGLNQIVRNLKKAKEDENIKGIYLDLSVVPSGFATIEEVRDALIDFKESGKFITCYSEIFTQKAYYLASVADNIYMNPEGMFDFRGFSAQVMFFKGAMDKLDIEAQIIRPKSNKFKSAVEPFFLDKMSDSNKKQMSKYLNSLWNHYLAGIAKYRKISVDELKIVADSILIRKPEDAVKYKLIDKLIYKDEFLAELRKNIGIGEDEKIITLSMSKYTKAPAKEISKSENKIAVIYASGGIGGGEGDAENIGSEKISRTLRIARKDSSIKAVVFRVNSPGGSALASEVIWREVKLTREIKPIIVSMGNYAASGGYYIACPATKIVAQENTLTGSIGVFGMLPNLKGFMNNKLGITVDVAKTSEYADYGTPFKPLSDYEASIIQNLVEDIYQTFIGHVAEDRNMTIEQVDSIGQGRIWSGIDAKKIGLVDEIGGMNKAIEIAAKEAGLDEYRIVELPKQKDMIIEFFKDLSGDTKQTYIKSELGESYRIYEYLKSMQEMEGVQARLPYLVEVN